MSIYACISFIRVPVESYQRRAKGTGRKPTSVSFRAVMGVESLTSHYVAHWKVWVVILAYYSVGCRGVVGLKSTVVPVSEEETNAAGLNSHKMNNSSSSERVSKRRHLTHQVATGSSIPVLVQSVPSIAFSQSHPPPEGTTHPPPRGERSFLELAYLLGLLVRSRLG
jgi:hypothetical protein